MRLPYSSTHLPPPSLPAKQSKLLLCMSLLVYVYGYVALYMHAVGRRQVYICVFAGMCVSVCLHVYQCLHTCASVCVCAQFCMQKRERVNERGRSERARVGVCVSVCMRVLMCVYSQCIHMYV